MESDESRTPATITFTLAEAAEMLHVHPETLRRAIKTEQLQAAKIGKEYRISKTELEAYWMAKGGGALFEDSPRAEPRAAGEARADRKKKDAPRGPQQLKLPTDA